MIVTRRDVIGSAAISAGAATLADGIGAATPNVVLIPIVHPDGRATTYRMMMPDRGGRWPVVLFSHGANSSSASYDRLWASWAARGCAVIGPDHIDSGPVARQAKSPPAGLWATRIADTVLPLHDTAPFAAVARTRGGRLDWAAVAAAGHSFGAVVAQGLAGARLTDPAGHAPSAATDPAIRACIAFSPPGPLAGFVPADAWASVAVPSFLQTGDADILPGFVDDWHRRLTGFARGAGRWTFVGHGVDHYFGGLICRLSPTAGAQSAALDEAAALSATFLTAYLTGDRGARARLAARAAHGDDGIATFAAATAEAARPSAATAAGLLPVALAGGLARPGDDGAAPLAAPTLSRRRLVQAALAVPFWPAAAAAQSAMQAVTAATAPPPTFAPSDVVPIRGATPPAPMPGPAGSTALDPRALAAAQAFSDGLGGTALLVWHDGHLLHEAYAPGFTAATRLKTYSMAKSVMGIAYGIAVAERIVTLDDTLGQHVAEVRGTPRAAITLRQLLQMRSGLKLDSLARHDPKAIELVIGRHVTQTALDTPLAGVPGAAFEYNNVNSFLAGLALDRALQRQGKGRYVEFLSRALWRPLGQADATLEVETTPAGEPRFFAGLDASARDWVRIGALFAQPAPRGRRAIVPPGWIAAMTTPTGNPNYGLQMWIGSPWTPQRRYGPNTPSIVPCKEPYLAPDLVFFDGAGGQRVYMVPSRRLVIVRTGAASPDWEDSTLPNTILRGMA